MKKAGKKWLGLLLALSMTIGIVPATALAEEDGQQNIAYEAKEEQQQTTNEEEQQQTTYGTEQTENEEGLVAAQAEYSEILQTFLDKLDGFPETVTKDNYATANAKFMDAYSYMVENYSDIDFTEQQIATEKTVEIVAKFIPLMRSAADELLSMLNGDGAFSQNDFDTVKTKWRFLNGVNQNYGRFIGALVEEEAFTAEYAQQLKADIEKLAGAATALGISSEAYQGFLDILKDFPTVVTKENYNEANKVLAKVWDYLEKFDQEIEANGESGLVESALLEKMTVFVNLMVTTVKELKEMLKDGEFSETDYDTVIDKWDFLSLVYNSYQWCVNDCLGEEEANQFWNDYNALKEAVAPLYYAKAEEMLSALPKPIDASNYLKAVGILNAVEFFCDKYDLDPEDFEEYTEALAAVAPFFYADADNLLVDLPEDITPDNCQDAATVLNTVYALLMANDLFYNWYDWQDGASEEKYDAACYDVLDVYEAAGYNTDALVNDDDCPYILSEEGMGYGYSCDDFVTFDIIGTFDDKWKQTTYDNGGYSTYMKIGDDAYPVQALPKSLKVEVMDTGLQVSIDPSIEGEQLARITYTVTNTTDAPISFALGSGADVQIGEDDGAIITAFEGNTGFKMISYDEDDARYDEEGNVIDRAQFNFFGKGNGVTDVSSFWYGAYSYGDICWSGNEEAAIFDYGDTECYTLEDYKKDNPDDDEPYLDSAASWRWENKTIAAGATKTYTIMIGIGGAGSEDAAEKVPDIPDNPGEEVGEGFTITFNATGGTLPEYTATTNNSGKLTSLPTPTLEGYTFDGWYDESGNPVTTDTVFTANTTIFAQWTMIPVEEVYSVSGNVVNEADETGVADATVKIGNVSTKTDANGSFTFKNLPAGEYNIVVTTEDDSKTVTKLVKIENADVSDIKVVIPTAKVSSKVEVEDDTPAVLVGGLDEVAKANADDGGAKVEVTLNVEKKTVTDVEEEVSIAIENKAAGKDKLEYLNMTVNKTVFGASASDTTTTAITNTGNVLEIIVPYDMTDKYNIAVYRHHGDEAQAFRKLTVRPTSGYQDGTFFVGDDFIVIYTSKFSYYAVGYDTTPSTPSGGVTGAPTTYPVSAPTNIAGGKVSVSPKNAAKGTTVTITVTAEENQKLDKLTVTDQNGNELKLTKVNDEKYTFVMPAGKVSIDAVFKAVEAAPEQETGKTVENCSKDGTCPMNLYKDVKVTGWYHDGIHFCIDNQYMTGYPDGTFQPDTATSRAMIISILWRMEGKPVVKDAMTFTDVKASDWCAEAIRWATANKVVNGYSETAFAPNDAITREQMMTILWNYCKYKGYDVSVGEDTNILSYKDANKISGWAVPAMQWACGSGMIYGTDDNTLDVKGDATRAQAANILYRFCKMAAED